MPLPPTPLTIHGGCNCRAIRYTIQIPALSGRALHPLVEASKTPPPTDPTACRLPFACWDHCNDCRSAVGSLLPAWLCTPADMVTVTAIISNSNISSSNPNHVYPNLDAAVPAGKFPKIRDEAVQGNAPLDKTTGESTITRPGLELLAPPFVKDASRTWLRYYESSEMRTRTFCGRCGTPLCYNISPMPEPWPDMLDIVLGTIDREDLEKVGEDGRGYLEPERQLWCGWGMHWLRRAVWDMPVPKHHKYAPDKEIEKLEDVVDQANPEQRVDY